MHVYSCLSIECNDDAFQASDVLVVVDRNSNRYLVAAEEATFQDIDCGSDNLPFDGWSRAIASYESTSIGDCVN